MLTESELKELMRLVHAIVQWQAYDANDNYGPTYDKTCDDLHEAVDDLSPVTIEKLTALINMRSAKVVQ